MKKSAETPAIPADIKVAISRVLAYMYDDEQENYEEREDEDEEDDEEEASDHIFLSLEALAKWVGWEAE